MAEVVGAVASGGGLASLGLQLAGCAVTLRKFCNEVKEAPRSLQRLSREINTFALLLQQIDRTRTTHDVADADALAESLDLCAEPTQEIVQATQKLEPVMHKYHGAGRVISPFLIREIKQLCADLERAKSTLGMAFQVFNHQALVRIFEATREMCVQQSSIQMQQSHVLAEVRADVAAIRTLAGRGQLNALPNMTDERHRPSNATAVVAITSRLQNDTTSDCGPTMRKAERRARPYRVRIPLWFSIKVWDISASHSQDGWDVCIRTFNIMPPSGSPALAHYVSGDVLALRKMFQNGEASPHDIYDRYTTLQLATMNHSVEVVRFLLEYRLSAYEDVLSDSFETFLFLVDNKNYSMEIGRLLIEQGGLDVGAYFESHSEKLCPAILFPLVRRNLLRPLETLEPQERFGLLSGTYRDAVTPELLLELCPISDEATSLSRLRSSKGTMAMHFVACKLALEELTYQGGWVSVLKHLISAGADQHPVNDDGETPLLSFLGPLFLNGRKPDEIERRLPSWACVLTEAGVDIHEYGSTENQIWQTLRSQAASHNRFLMDKVDLYTSEQWRVLP